MSTQFPQVRKATREGYGDGLAGLAKENSRVVVLDADLSKSTKTAEFQKAAPERFINCGIAECNMMSIAAGMAAAGFIPFASSFAMFAAGRAFEQVRNSVGYPHLNVKIGATHAGISVGEDGATHQCNEDLALMRAIPGMTVINPADYYEARAAVYAAAAYDGPVYLRFGRLAVPTLEGSGERPFVIGRGVTLRQGRDVAIAATGLMVTAAVHAAALLEKDGIDARVLNIHTIKPLDAEIIVRAARETGALVTAEEHSILGGLGGAVCETVCRACPVPVLRVGMNDEFGVSGPAEELLERYHLTAGNMAAKAKEALALKQSLRNV